MMASKVGRVDAFVQSTDKNFRVPVGGAIIAGFDDEALHAIAKSYPGRGSATPAIDLLMTLLWQGSRGWQQALADRKQTFLHLRTSLEKIAAEFDERVLNTPSNQISLALSLSTFDRLNDRKFLTGIGAHLFARCCTGARVVPKDDRKSIEGIDFVGWGGHSSDVKFSYLNVACAIGMTAAEVDILIDRLRKTLLHARKQMTAKLDA
uniref:O-phosphoseryl-tRNA(Sec) selenium transferase n=1 Tax=Plectus sambesii TaxID=2011161 RepID=A0A914X0H3_9BILA